MKKKNSHIAFRTGSSAVFIDMSAASGGSTGKSADKLRVPVADDSNTLPWAPWGEDNLLPVQMAADIEKCGVLNAVIDGKTRFALGRGILPVYTTINKDGSEDITDVVQDREVLDWLEANDDYSQCFAWFMDMNAIGNGVVRFGLTANKKKIDVMQRDDVTEMRYERMTSQGHINNIYLHAQWDQVAGPDNKNLVKVPLLRSYNPAADLKDRAGSASEFAMTFRRPAWQRRYYSMPLWYAAYKWVKIAQGVPDMKAALFENNMRIKYMVIIYQDYWTNTFGEEWEDYTDEQQEEKRQALYDEIDKFLVGSKNAYKSIYVDGYYDKINGNKWQDIEIKAIDDNTKPGELLPDAAAANSEIAFSMMINPAIFGGSLPSGPYTNSQGGSNIREGSLLQIMTAEFERRQVRRIMNVVKTFNGWDPKIQFIIPASVMTTLDTGHSTKNVIN